MSSHRPERTQLVLTPPGTKTPVSMWFVNVPACPEGFLMGGRGQDADAEPIHRVAIHRVAIPEDFCPDEDDFWLGETAVTQAQFDVWTQATGHSHAHHFKGKPDHPAENLTWHEAMEFCGWLTETCAKQFPKGFCFAELPCEAQWEYACRGGTATEYHTGDGEAALREAGWHGEDWSSGSTHPCGGKARNPFGLYDMHGNVWEWCLDRWDSSAYRRRWDGITDRETYRLNEKFGDQDSNPNRVLRGGSCMCTASRCRSAFRNWDRAGNRLRSGGFRVCLVRSPLASQTSTAEPERTDSQRRDGAEGAGSDGEAEKF